MSREELKSIMNVNKKIWNFFFIIKIRISIIYLYVNHCKFYKFVKLLDERNGDKTVGRDRINYIYLLWLVPQTAAPDRVDFAARVMLIIITDPPLGNVSVPSHPRAHSSAGVWSNGPFGGSFRLTHSVDTICAAHFPLTHKMSNSGDCWDCLNGINMT